MGPGSWCGKIVDGRMHAWEPPTALWRRSTTISLTTCGSNSSGNRPDHAALRHRLRLGGSSFISYGYLLQFGARSNQANQLYAPSPRHAFSARREAAVRD